MRRPVSFAHSSKVSQAALIALISAAAAGCSSDVSRFGEPVYTGATPNQRNIISGPQTYAPDFNATGSVNPPLPAPVQGAALPPVAAQPYAMAPAVQPTYVAPAVQPTYVAPAVQPAYVAPRASAPAYTPVSTGTTNRPVATTYPPQSPPPSNWSTDKGSYVTLGQGEDINSLSRRYGVPASAILHANNFADPTRVQAGQRVLIPTYSAAPAVAPAIAQTPAPARAPVAAAPQPARATVASPARPVVPAAARTAAASAPAKAATPAAAPAKVAAAAPVVAPSPVKAAEAVAVTGTMVGPHVVKPGENLERIANAYGVDKKRLMAANNLKSELIRPGQKLTLPSGAVLRVAQAPVPAATTEAPILAAQPKVGVETAKAQAIAAPVPTKPVETKVASLSPAAAPAPAAAASQPHEVVAVAKEPTPAETVTRTDAKDGTPSFRWPVRGRVIKEFGTANGERNDGINLAVPEGTSIKAAEDGEVIYSGNEIKGYGNLVLIQHKDGWVTAYAHASELLVNRGDKVTRGHIIARAGATGGVSQPQLHFEIRRGQRPVDPKQYLASN